MCKWKKKNIASRYSDNQNCSVQYEYHVLLHKYALAERDLSEHCLAHIIMRFYFQSHFCWHPHYLSLLPSLPHSSLLSATHRHQPLSATSVSTQHRQQDNQADCDFKLLLNYNVLLKGCLLLLLLLLVLFYRDLNTSVDLLSLEVQQLEEVYLLPPTRPPPNTRFRHNRIPHSISPTNTKFRIHFSLTHEFSYEHCRLNTTKYCSRTPHGKSLINSLFVCIIL